MTPGNVLKEPFIPHQNCLFGPLERRKIISFGFVSILSLIGNKAKEINVTSKRFCIFTQSIKTTMKYFTAIYCFAVHFSSLKVSVFH